MSPALCLPGTLQAPIDSPGPPDHSPHGGGDFRDGNVVGCGSAMNEYFFHWRYASALSVRAKNSISPKPDLNTQGSIHAAARTLGHNFVIGTMARLAREACSFWYAKERRVK